MVAALIGLAAGRAAADAVDGTSSPWAGCQARRLDGTVFEVKCSDRRVRVMRAPTLGSREGVRSMASRFGDPSTLERRVIPSGRSELEMLTVRTQQGVTALAAPLEGVLATCTPDPGVPVTVCDDAMRALATTGLPPGVQFPATSLALLGRAFQLPAGCEMAGAERIRCTNGFSLDWRDGGRGTPERALEGYRSALPATLRVTARRPVPCRLSGVEARGEALTLMAGSNEAHVVVCAAQGATGVGVAMCIGPTEAAPPWPAPCALVFDRPD